MQFQSSQFNQQPGVSRNDQKIKNFGNVQSPPSAFQNFQQISPKKSENLEKNRNLSTPPQHQGGFVQEQATVTKGYTYFQQQKGTEGTIKKLNQQQQQDAQISKKFMNENEKQQKNQNKEVLLVNSQFNLQRADISEQQEKVAYKLHLEAKNVDYHLQQEIQQIQHEISFMKQKIYDIEIEQKHKKKNNEIFDSFSQKIDKNQNQFKSLKQDVISNNLKLSQQIASEIQSLKGNEIAKLTSLIEQQKQQHQLLLEENILFKDSYEELKRKYDSQEKLILNLESTLTDQLNQSKLTFCQKLDAISERLQKHDLDLKGFRDYLEQILIQYAQISQKLDGEEVQIQKNRRLHPEKNRLKIVQDLINSIYNKSCRKRAVQGDFQKFIRDKQNLNELYRNYSIRHSEIKNSLQEICNAFRQTRGDGNCFYTAIGFQYFDLLLHTYTQNEFGKFIDNIDKIITFQIIYDQELQIKDEQLQDECWQELKYRLCYLRNAQNKEEYIQHYQAYEQAFDNQLVDGCFFGLSTIFFRNLAKYLIDRSEFKQSKCDNLLIWEEGCSNNILVINELSKFLKVHIQLLVFDSGQFQLSEYQKEWSHKIIILMQPGHYNIGYKDEKQSNKNEYDKE